MNKFAAGWCLVLIALCLLAVAWGAENAFDPVAWLDVEGGVHSHWLSATLCGLSAGVVGIRLIAGDPWVLVVAFGVFLVVTVDSVEPEFGGMVQCQRLSWRFGWLLIAGPTVAVVLDWVERTEIARYAQDEG